VEEEATEVEDMVEGATAEGAMVETLVEAPTTKVHGTRILLHKFHALCQRIRMYHPCGLRRE